MKQCTPDYANGNVDVNGYDLNIYLLILLIPFFNKIDVWELKNLLRYKNELTVETFGQYKEVSALTCTIWTISGQLSGPVTPENWTKERRKNKIERDTDIQYQNNTYTTRTN